MKFEASTNWIKQTNFTFATCVSYLKSRIDSQDDPIVLIALYRLFDKLGDKVATLKLQHKLETYIENLPDWQDSGFQMRDCLLVSLYASLNNWYIQNPIKFEAIVLPRLKNAITANWFNDPELVASILSIEWNKYDFSIIAEEYFRKHVGSWLKKDYLNGLLYYGLHFETDTKVNEYLKNIDWGKQDLVKQSLALVYFRQATISTIEIQNGLANSVYYKLNLNNGESRLDEEKGIDHESPLENYFVLSDHEIALALLGLHEAGFDEVIGIKNPKSIEYESLINYLEQIKKGGFFITKNYLKFYEVSLLVSLVLILFFLTQLIDVPNIGPLAGGLIEPIMVVIVFVLAALFVRQKRPSQIITKEFFGINGEIDNEHKQEI